MGKVIAWNPSAKVRGPVLATGTTAKQEAFAQAVVLEGMNFSDAYRSSHCTDGMKAATLWVKASALAKTDKVRVRMHALQAEMERQIYEDAGHVRRLVIDKLYHEALNAPQASARIRALELLGKLDGVSIFRERREVRVTDQRSSDEITGELMDRLTIFLSSSLTS